MQYQIVHLASSLVLCCAWNYLNPNVVRLYPNKDPHYPGSLWNLQESGNGDNTFYICNDHCGTCLGNLRSPVVFDFIGADFKEKATGKQLLWYLNDTDQTIVAADGLHHFVTVRDITKEPDYPALEIYTKLNSKEADSQKFALVNEAD